MSDAEIDLNIFKGRALEIAADVDRRYITDGKLSGEEISIFLADCEREGLRIYQEAWYPEFNNAINPKPTEEPDALYTARPVYIEEIPVADNKKAVDDSADNETKRNLDIIKYYLKGAHLTKEQEDYWIDKIRRNSDLANVPDSLTSAIITRECGLQPNIQSKNGNGSMGITTIPLADMMNSYRSKIYKKIDENLYNEIFYKKDASGNFITDKNGNYVLKYNSPQELRAACGQDDDLSTKAGLMIFKMKYVEAAGKTLGISLNAVADGLKNKTVTLSPVQNQAAFRLALENYNGSPRKKDYADKIMQAVTEAEGQDFIDNFAIF